VAEYVCITFYQKGEGNNMLSTKDAKQLEERSYTIHTQLLEEHGNVLDNAHRLALRAIHNQLANMVNGEDSHWHGRFGVAAPIGFGKSSAIAAFIAAAHQLRLLGNGVTLLLTAYRVQQLYDFEDAILDAGLPQVELRKFVSVMHSLPSADVRRSSDTNEDAPVLMVAHNKIKTTYRKGERKHGGSNRPEELVHFLKFHDEPRDLVVWDERAMVSESVAVQMRDLDDALTLMEKHNVLYEVRSWLADALIIMQARLTTITEEGVLLNDLPKCDTWRFLELLKGRESRALAWSQRLAVQTFLRVLPYSVRLLPQGVVSFRMVMPDCIENLLNLDASFSVSELSKMDKSIQNLEDAHPMLRLLQDHYGKRLADLKDCRHLTFTRWDVAAGKDAVSEAIQEYLEGQPEAGNLILDLLAWIKTQINDTTDHAVMIWTHKYGTGDYKNTDLFDLLRRCFLKGGIDVDHLQVEVRYKSKPPVLRPQVVIGTYGSHDASNALSYCDKAVLLGVQRREDLDVSGHILGQERNILAEVSRPRLRKTQLAEEAVVAQQTIGRGTSRQTVNGVALPQDTLLIYKDKRSGRLTDLLKPLYPGAIWTEYQPAFKPVSQDSFAAWVSKGVAYIEQHARQPVSSQALKKAIGAGDVPRRTWTRMVESICNDGRCVLSGRTITPIFEVETC
jgi:hypothetical protein